MTFVDDCMYTHLGCDIFFRRRVSSERERLSSLKAAFSFSSSSIQKCVSVFAQTNKSCAEVAVTPILSITKLPSFHCDPKKIFGSIFWLNLSFQRYLDELYSI